MASTPPATVCAVLDSVTFDPQAWTVMDIPESLIAVQWTVIALSGALVQTGVVADTPSVQVDKSDTPRLIVHVAAPFTVTTALGVLEGKASVPGETVRADTLPIKGLMLSRDNGVARKAGRAINTIAKKQYASGAM